MESTNNYLDKSKFNKEINVISVKVPVKEIQDFNKRFHDLTLAMPKIKNVRNIEGDDQHKLILLTCKNEDLEKFVQEKKYVINDKETVPITYENMTISEILKEVLPSNTGQQLPSGFETIGDIAHMNLYEAFHPYKFLIGQVVLDKNPNLRTVVNKIGQIESTYRFYDLECIAGDSSTYETTHNEDKIKFRVDISKVYWCSKLDTERQRMVSLMKEGEVLCDMFCGIGPLALRAAVKRKVKVLANDLNPECFKYLKQNIDLNKVKNLIVPFNMDARELARLVIKKGTEASQEEIPKDFLRFDHVYMNLPVDAVEFLDVFVGLFDQANPKIWSEESNGLRKWKMPIIHVNGFTYELDKEKAQAYFVERIGKAMKYPEFNSSNLLHFHDIRDVSPISHMYCVSFRLPEEVAFSSLKKDKPDSAIYDEFEDKSRQKIRKTSDQ